MSGVMCQLPWFCFTLEKMHTRHRKRLPLVLGAVFFTCCIAACESGTRDPASDEREAGRRNVDAMSSEHADDTGTPSPAAAIEPERAVISEESIAYGEVEDELVRGHFSVPADTVPPAALIVIHEWWGLNEGVRAMADRLAGAGYTVLAVDLFGGRTTLDPNEARSFMLEVVEDPELANENLRQAYGFLREVAGAERVGVLGWCFGGGWSLNTALLFLDELEAAVIYYGQVTDNEDKLEPLNVPILGLFGENDRGITVDTVRAFEQALENLGKDYEIEIYPNVGHAFANPSGNNYNPQIAEMAWSRTLDFLARHMAADEE